MHAAAPTVPASPYQYPLLSLSNFRQDKIQGEDAKRSSYHIRLQVSSLYVLLSLFRSLDTLSLSRSLDTLSLSRSFDTLLRYSPYLFPTLSLLLNTPFVSVVTLSPSLIMHITVAISNTAKAISKGYKLREKRGKMVVEGQQKSIRVTKVNTGQRESMRSTSDFTGATWSTQSAETMVRRWATEINGGQRRSTEVNGGQRRSMEINGSQQKSTEVYKSNLEPRRANRSQQDPLD